MRKSIFVIVFLLLATVANGGDGIHGSSGISRTQFIAGFTNFRPYALNDQFGLTGDNQFSQLITYGIGGTGTMNINRASDFDCSFNFLLYNPTEITSPLDTSTLQIRGWELMTSIYGYDILKKVKAVDLVVAPGFFFGCVKLKREVAIQPNLQMRYKNPFGAPMIRIDLRFNYRRVSIGARASYRSDGSSSNWKERDGDLTDMPSYRFREAQYVIYLGINFVDWSKVPFSESTEDDTEN